MASEEAKNVKENFEEEWGSLRGCLVDGDAQARQVQGKVRRRALVISVVVQSVALTLLLLAPLFGKTERIAVKDWVPMPPYGPVGQAPKGAKRAGPGESPIHKLGFAFPRPLQPISKLPREETTSEDPTPFLPSDGKNGETIGCGWCEIAGATEKGPTPPVVENRKGPRVVQLTKIDPAMLKHRVEPVYPELARQTHKSGRVELRARIGIDGRIEALQIVVGDPVFDQSARNAVQEWIYKPTFLNGQPVEVETYITVIYSSRQ